MINKQIRPVLMVVFMITGTVAPMQQPTAGEKNKPSWYANVKNWGSCKYESFRNSMYGAFFAQPEDDYDIGTTTTKTTPPVQQPTHNQQQQTGNNTQQQKQSSTQASTDSQSSTNSQSQSTQSTIHSQQGQTTSSLTAPKKPTTWYYVLGGSLLVSGITLVYKAINYIRLTGLQRNLNSLDTLILAARPDSHVNLSQVYQRCQDDLTLLLEQDKGLLQLLLPEKEKFQDAAVKIKEELTQKVKESIFTRISYGIKDDIKRAQGWSQRARDAIKNKLSKVFKGIR